MANTKINPWPKCKWCGAEKRTRVPLCGACKVYMRTVIKVKQQLEHRKPKYNN